MKPLILIALCFAAFLAHGQSKNAHQQNDPDSLINTYQQKGLNDTLINNEKTAVAVAEAILFNIYGEKQIESEKPYSVVYQKGCWYIDGTLPKYSLGGVFSIVINAKDGKAVVFPHGK